MTTDKVCCETVAAECPVSGESTVKTSDKQAGPAAGSAVSVATTSDSQPQQSLQQSLTGFPML